MTKKDLVTKVIFNTLKMWGCSWLAVALTILPWNLLRTMVRTVDDTKDLSNFWYFIVAGLVACVFLFFFAHREAYKEGHISQTKSFLILGAILPAALYFLITVVTFGNVYVCCLSTMMAEVLAREAENIKMAHILISGLMFYPFFSVALYFGAFFGRKKRAKDKIKLTEEAQ